MVGIMETQIDWIPLSIGAIRQLRKNIGGDGIIWRLTVIQRRKPDAGSKQGMRMITIPNQSSVTKACLKFDENDRMKPSAYYGRMVDGLRESIGLD